MLILRIIVVIFLFSFASAAAQSNRKAFTERQNLDQDTGQRSHRTALMQSLQNSMNATEISEEARRDSYSIKNALKALPARLKEWPENSLVEQENRRAMVMEKQREKMSIASRFFTFPTSANSAGQFGSFFRTRGVITNVTNRTYDVELSLYNANGLVGRQRITIGPMQSLGSENLLQDVWGYSGAGAVEVDSFVRLPNGSLENDFIADMQVYNTGGTGGRFSTHVPALGSLDFLSVTYPNYINNLARGPNRRINFGCYNGSSLASSLYVTVFDGQGSPSQRVGPIPLRGNSWFQENISNQDPNPALGLMLKLEPTSAQTYCFVVENDNQSSDGTLMYPITHVP